MDFAPIPTSTLPALDDTFWFAQSLLLTASLATVEPTAIVVWLEVPLIRILPALLDMFCKAVLPLFDRFDTVELDTEAIWLEIAPAAMVIDEGDTGPAAMAAAVNALSAKNASFFMMSSPRSKVTNLLSAPSFRWNFWCLQRW